MREKWSHGGGHHGRTHRVDKLLPTMNTHKSRKSGDRNDYIYLNPFSLAGKKLAKKRHKKKTRQYNKQLCRDDEIW